MIKKTQIWKPPQIKDPDQFNPVTSEGESEEEELNLLVSESEGQTIPKQLFSQRILESEIDDLRKKNSSPVTSGFDHLITKSAHEEANNKEAQTKCSSIKNLKVQAHHFK